MEERRGKTVKSELEKYILISPLALVNPIEYHH
jgi:hypothetical protein